MSSKPIANFENPRVTYIRFSIVHCKINDENVYFITTYLRKHIPNFENPRVTYIGFSIFFMALCWYSCFSFMPTSTPISNVQLTAALLARVLARLRFLPIPKNGSKNLYQISCKKQNKVHGLIPNIDCSKW